MTIKIEIPSDNKPLAVAIGAALVAFANNEALGALTVTSDTIVTAEEKSALTPKPSALTVMEQASSTVTQTSEAATVSNQSSEVKTTTGESAGQSQEQSTVEQGVDAAQDATVVNNVVVGSEITAANDPNKLDEKGVGFNTQFCGNAAKPFYGSGKTKGQWKRRQGVDQADYDAWYAASLAATSGQDQQIDTTSAFQSDNVQQINTASAFNGEQVNDGQNHQPQQQGGLTFADAGAFMQWLSEQQAAELITAADIDSAYTATQSSMDDLFDPAKSANAIAAVYNFLANIAQGQQ